MKKIINNLFFGLALLFGFSASSQSLADGIFMPKNTICGGLFYGQEQFSKYWEGTALRSNKNIGAMTMKSASLAAIYGITDNINVVVSAPYISTSASGGVLSGNSGLQDLTAALKYHIYGWNDFHIIGFLGGTLPLTNYVAANPLAIGNQSKSIFGKAMLHYLNNKNWTFAAQVAYFLRSNITIDAANYYTDQNVFSNQVRIDNVLQLGIRGGYYTYRMQVEVTLDRSAVQGGFDIRRQDMMFPSNRQESTRLGLLSTYRIPFLADLQVLANVSYVVDGRNVGQSTAFMFGLTKTLDFNKKKPEPANNIIKNN